jgi:L-ribulose-5-phosphate 3-epimerase
MRLAIKGFMYVDPSLEAMRLRRLADVGVEGIEVLTGQPDPTGLRAAATAAGVGIASVIAEASFFQSATDPEDANRQAVSAGVVEAVRIAADLGAPVVALSPGMVRGDLHPDDLADLSRATLAAAAAAADAAGVRLAFENLWNGWLTSPRDLAAFADSLGAGVLFDIGNAERYSPAQHWIRELSHRIVRVDVKDFKRAWHGRPAQVYADDADLRRVWGPDGPWGALDALPFDGDADWPAIARALRDIGYDGWLCSEHGAGDQRWIGDLVSRLARLRDLIDETEPTNGRKGTS